MRDGNLHAIIEKLDLKINNLYKQSLFLDIRLRAYETILESRLAMFLSFLNPTWLKKEVDRRQMDMIQEHDIKVHATIKKKQEEASKPKITLINPSNGLKNICFLIVLCGTFMGCVPKWVHDDELTQQKKDFQMIITSYKEELDAKTARLALFNQVNEDGSLRTKENNDLDGWDN